MNICAADNSDIYSEKLETPTSFAHSAGISANHQQPCTQTQTDNKGKTEGAIKPIGLLTYSMEQSPS
jgi:hypothetical protein